jgi:hypothetical protein
VLITTSNTPRYSQSIASAVASRRPQLAVRRGDNPWAVFGWIALSALLLLSSGCSRSYYRQQADDDVYRLVSEHTSDPRWPLKDYTIDVDPRSRMYDPYSPDHEPIPPDDPASHRLMHRVDGKRGYPRWHANGDTSYVDNPDWPAHLPLDENGTLVLDMAGVMQMAYLHSTDYQRELEDLYLSALDVSFERFRFDVQFFGGNDTTYTADGRVRGDATTRSSLTTATDLQMQRLFTTGGELVVGLANSIVWQFAGATTDNTTTLIDFSLVQPLLRAGGRERVMERLTVSERTLLANVRQMERFRRGFFVEITTGGDAGPGPSRRGGFFGGSGLDGFTGVGGGGFGRVGSSSGTGFSGGAGAREAGGYLGILQEQQQLRNQETNVIALGDSLAQLESLFQADREDKFQVDLARQAFYRAQSVLMSDKASYQGRLDEFVRNLGLPPDLNVEIADGALDQFNLIGPALRSLQRSLSEIQLSAGNVIQQFREADEPADDASVRVEEMRLRMLLAVEDCNKAIEAVADVEADLDKLTNVLPLRTRHLKQLSDRVKAARYEVDPGLLDGAKLAEIPPKLRGELADLKKRLDATPAKLKRLAEKLSELKAAVETAKPEKWRTTAEALVAQIPEQLMELSTDVLELSLIQAKARTETIVLEPVDLDAQRALEVAAVNRRDWMNARAALVDAYRLVEFNANDLESNLDIVFSGDISNVGNNPARLRNTNGRLRVGLEFDAPITRLAERNIYRQALIEYQQARRQYYETVDRINQGLRATLRTIELNKLNFELRRAAIRVAVSQVELIRLRLNEPAKPGEVQTVQPSRGRDLVTALSDLLNVQNEFLSVWVNYEVLRLGLDFNLGTMQLNEQGLWIDPGPLDETFQAPFQAPLQAPRHETSPDVDSAEVSAAPYRVPIQQRSAPQSMPGVINTVGGPPPLIVPKRLSAMTAVRSNPIASRDRHRSQRPRRARPRPTFPGVLSDPAALK